MSDKGVCRTAPATSGPLNIEAIYFNFIFIEKKKKIALKISSKQHVNYMETRYAEIWELGRPSHPAVNCTLLEE